MLAAFLLGWFGAPDAALPWTAMLVIVFLLPDFLRSLRAMTVKPRHLSWSTYLPYAGAKELRGWAISLLELLLIPFHASIYVAEILRTQWRLVSHRHLLEWQTASDAGRQARTTLASTFLAMWPAPVAAAVVAVLLAGRMVVRQHASRAGVDHRRGPAPGRMVRLAGDHVVPGTSGVAPQRRHR